VACQSSVRSEPDCSSTPLEPKTQQGQGGPNISVSFSDESLLFFILRLLDHLREMPTSPAADLTEYGRSFRCRLEPKARIRSKAIGTQSDLSPRTQKAATCDHDLGQNPPSPLTLATWTARQYRHPPEAQWRLRG
jgi:hypothetical protein